MKRGRGQEGTGIKVRTLRAEFSVSLEVLPKL